MFQQFVEMTSIFILGRHNTKQSLPSSQVIFLLTIFTTHACQAGITKANTQKGYIHGLSPFFLLFVLLCLTYIKQVIFIVHFIPSLGLQFYNLKHLVQTTCLTSKPRQEKNCISALHLMLTVLKTCLLLFYQQLANQLYLRKSSQIM